MNLSELRTESPRMTPWMPAHDRPVRPGWYERHYMDGIFRHYWDGQFWRFSPSSNKHWRQCDLEYPMWRGLAQPTEVEPESGWVELTVEEVVRKANQDENPASFARGAAWAEAMLRGRNT